MYVEGATLSGTSAAKLATPKNFDQVHGRERPLPNDELLKTCEVGFATAGQASRGTLGSRSIKDITDITSTDYIPITRPCIAFYRGSASRRRRFSKGPQLIGRIAPRIRSLWVSASARDERLLS